MDQLVTTKTTCVVCHEPYEAVHCAGDQPPAYPVHARCTREARMVQLARSFPVLQLCAAPLNTWDAKRLARWGRGPAAGSGARHAVRFLLSVWNHHTRWAIGRFDLHGALACWDAGNRAAFLAWAKDPWWP